MIGRRDVLSFSSLGALASGALGLLKPRTAAADPAGPALHGPAGHPPITVPNVPSLPFERDGDTKVFRLVAEPVKHEVAPGMVINAWGYNGHCPGPTIEVVEGDKVRLFVTNKLPERTTVHWHGLFVPNGMDGVAGLNQPHVMPGETYVYELTIRQSGVYLYHPHSDEMVQMALGMMGFFVAHPRVPLAPRVDRHFAILLHEWFVEPGTATPNPMIMNDFNLFTFNARAWPGTAPLVVKTGDRVRLSFANLSMDSHPIHLHGHRFWHVATDGGAVPPSARVPMTTINVPVGSVQTVELVADAPGDWALHCHKTHHTMNPMGHDVPNMIGVAPGAGGAAAKVKKLLPGYMPMGETGMGNMMEMGRPKNTLPMMTGTGPFGDIEMGGMFTVFKVRDRLARYDVDPGWYTYPPGTVARKV